MIKIKADVTAVECSIEGSTEKIMTEATLTMVAIAKSMIKMTGMPFEVNIDALAKASKHAFNITEGKIVEIDLSALAKQKGEE